MYFIERECESTGVQAEGGAERGGERDFKEMPR